MYEDVLLPFDGSEGATTVLRHAAEIADWADATIRVLFVADTSRDSVTVVEGQTVDALAKQGERVVEGAAETLRSLGVDPKTDVVQGNPAVTIADYAEQYGYDLVVMPTRGREGISRYLVGSVTEKVVRLSSVPVLTARLQPDERLAFPYENVLVPTDGSPVSMRAVDHGLELAAALGATTHAVAVADDTSLGPDVRSTVASDAGETAAREALEDVTEAASAYELGPVVEHLERGKPVDGILSCIDEHDIDAVVMGTTGRRGTDRILLGSVTEKTVRSAPVPVITVGE